ncbi:MAG: capsule assembly Wzi family protein [Bacteroidales bacterium]
MRKRAISLAALVYLLAIGAAAGQDNTYNFTVQTLGGYTTPGVVPFWLRSNQYGSIPLDGASLSFIGTARKDYDLSGDKLFDWGASFEGRANLGQGSNLTLIEGYGKVRLGIFELRAGRSKKITGLCDTTLTSGSWAISGTNLGIPEVELSVRDFWTLPILGELFAFKGNFSHGWMGDLRMARYLEQDTLLINSYLHQKSLYGRFGKPGWKIKLYAGFNHQVVWGNEQDYYTEDYTLEPLETYLYVITGKKFSNGYIQEERQGNHLGSIDLGLEYEFEKIKLFIYRQNLYEAGALAHLANIQDGLNGISLQNLHRDGKPGIWDKMLLELLYTKNQAGEPWSPESGSPYEPYYNHGQYITGWSYLGSGLGTSFITTRDYIRENLPAHPEEYFINNRVMALHFGFEGSFRTLSYTLKASWSKNYGTYRTTDEEQSTEITNPGEYGIFGEQEQISSYFGVNKRFTNGLILGLIGAFDYGDLYYNSFGMFLRASYSFSL